MNLFSMTSIFKRKAGWGKILCWVLFLHLGLAVFPDLNHVAITLKGFLPFELDDDPDNCPFCQYDDQAGAALPTLGGIGLGNQNTSHQGEFLPENTLTSFDVTNTHWAQPPPPLFS